MPGHPTHYYGSGDLHFITAGCYRRRPFLGMPARRDLFLDVLEQMRRRYRTAKRFRCARDDKGTRAAIPP
jgi:REP element-mobilizing transposase RayT